MLVADFPEGPTIKEGEPKEGEPDFSAKEFGGDEVTSIISRT